MDIVFIRHGKTAGNIEKRYVGVTDEPLNYKLLSEIDKGIYPNADFVISSSMKRCVETANFIYPDREILIEKRFNECNFGDFEGKNYLELSQNSDYQKWIDSNGTMPFPNGEDIKNFKQRCVLGFEDIIKKHSYRECVSFVVHGGTIMSILEKYNDDNKGYFDFMCDNLDGFICSWEDFRCTNIRSLR